MQLTSKILAFYFIIGSFLPYTDFSQLTKIAELVEHYKLHELEAISERADYSIWIFLYDHFISYEDHTHHKDDDSHNDLPFKVVKVGHNLFSNAPLINYVPFFEWIIPLPAFSNSLHLKGFFKIFFHPPAACLCCSI